MVGDAGSRTAVLVGRPDVGSERGATLLEGFADLRWTARGGSGPDVCSRDGGDMIQSSLNPGSQRYLIIDSTIVLGIHLIFLLQQCTTFIISLYCFNYCCFYSF